MSPEVFAGLLSSLGKTPADSADQYERLRSKLIFFFSSRSLAFPEDLADEVLDRLAHRLVEGIAIASVPAFALGIARLVVLEQNSNRHVAQTMEDTFWNNVPAQPPTHSEEEEIARLERCLKRLPSSEAKLLRGYYLAVRDNPIQARKSFAARLGISPNTLRQRVFLARQTLRACMTAKRRPDKGWAE
jgi:DNA-directed RNA polymerase specialized sigma24 family protein